MAKAFTKQHAKKLLNELYKLRKKAVKKGDSGRVLIIGGSSQYSGAPSFAGNAALLALKGAAGLRAWADIAVIACPSAIASAVACLSRDIIVKPIGKMSYFSKKHAVNLADFSKNFNAVVLGNGLSLKSLEFAKYFLAKTRHLDAYIIVDADAVKALSLKNVGNKNLILTPHAGEFKILTNMVLPDNLEKRIKIINGLNFGDSAVIVKGSTDIIKFRNKIITIKSGNNAMTKGGTGDILAGLVGGFLGMARKLDPAFAEKNKAELVALSAYVNGLAGNIAFKKQGYSLISSDLLLEISRAIKKIRM